MSRLGLRFFLASFLILGTLNLIENLAVLWQLRETNRALKSIAEATATMKEDLNHVHDEVEANGESLDYLTELLDARQN